jgi:hypothetical protein
VESRSSSAAPIGGGDGPVAAAISAPPNLRTNLGTAATAGSLLILVFPGYLALPSLALDPLVQALGSECPSHLGSLVRLAVLVLGGFLISFLLIAIGVIALVLIGRRARSGFRVGVVFNTIVASLLLTTSMTVSWGAPTEGGQWLVGLFSLCGLVPVAGAVLMLDPSLFQSSRQFAATLVSAALLLSPGAVGVTVFGLQQVGIVPFPLVSSTYDVSHCFIGPPN